MTLEVAKLHVASSLSSVQEFQSQRVTAGGLTRIHLQGQLKCVHLHPPRDNQLLVELLEDLQQDVVRAESEAGTAAPGHHLLDFRGAVDFDDGNLEEILRATGGRALRRL